MQRTAENMHGGLAATIRQQSTTAAMRRYANSLPLYAVAKDVPDYFADMLKKIEAAEATAKR